MRSEELGVRNYGAPAAIEIIAAAGEIATPSCAMVRNDSVWVLYVLTDIVHDRQRRD